MTTTNIDTVKELRDLLSSVEDEFAIDNSSEVNTMNTNNSTETTYNIRKTAIALNISEQYVRHLIIDEKLYAEKDQDGHWFVTQDTIDEYLESHNSTTKTTSYIVNLTNEQVLYFQSHHPEIALTKRFDAVKAKEYRMKRAIKSN